MRSPLPEGAPCCSRSCTSWSAGSSEPEVADQTRRLKDRKGRTLSDEDLAHYQKIVVALSETIRLMKEIDEVIDAHGGWPGAFRGAPLEAAGTV